ncbi:MAG: RNA pseudouridine synthase [Treponema sp.]|jgi:23S rRNA pseudouridine1911/1915/1917 synthase|nr:RNA pseudouridine synthase [Treponema sp.]
MAAAVQSPETPQLIEETEDFAVVYKPPRVHCVPLRAGEGGTLLEWYARLFPPVAALHGKRPLEGGILHRLDYETQGLVLFGKTQAALENLFIQQEEGRFVKEYGAISHRAGASPPLPGFPPPPALPGSGTFCIRSYFRSYGPGGKAVRPLAGLNRPGKKTASDRGRPYETEIVETAEPGKEFRYFTLRIKRGFRHQIRCHLAWLGNPIRGDPLYGQAGKDTAPPEEGAVNPPEGPLALRAQGLFFFDPQNGRPREYRILSLGGYTSI